ncbi:MAG: hypothetical protein IAI50_08385 [Candidatus Eremiobacteraeota bacterium]|nr:hypothetical protein [Candidatus Eremiobacteraeota bacterium]
MSINQSDESSGTEATHEFHEHVHDHTNDHVELVGAFRFCPSCGNPVLAKDDFGLTPAMRMQEGTLVGIEEIRCSKCYLPWTSCPGGIKH